MHHHTHSVMDRNECSEKIQHPTLEDSSDSQKQRSFALLSCHGFSANSLSQRSSQHLGEVGSMVVVCVCVCLRGENEVCGLTVKPMPTVAVKDPGMNLPWSY